MIALIEYGAGNTASVSNALKEIGVEHIISKNEKDISEADKIIFPGVGEASSAVKKLHLLNLFSLLRVIKKPMLGICLGMHILCDRSEEGDVACLGVINGEAKKFDTTKVKVPHMGWNNVNISKDSKLFNNIDDKSYFYFAHSYYIPKNDSTIATTEHDLEFCAVLEKDNFYGVQFHPEKSGEAGLQLLKNFVELC
ncbi:MAG: imidazole glycerol phosphate synthase subunit HisH [Melioribacteraceae bacterium]|nr:imidazole glycerol phosphate synthase subunit HisH [Melioribacteraceae bacterium]WKZ68242.1 MAG: imidazole glycerol phosphate synthase subunit HisH [Melioribacteraceae bacterium]